MKRIFALFFLLLALTAATRSAEQQTIPGGKFAPMYGTEKPGQEVEVKPFRIDVLPVTNREFFAFTKQYPQWKHGNPATLFADKEYLRDWSAEGAPRKNNLELPVTSVSWFAAQAFCQSKGGHLPTVFEWEFVAAASKDLPDASRDPAFVEHLLEWYSKPSTGIGALPPLKNSESNFWGVRALHGYVWEWVEDFNSIFVAGDSRRDGEQLKNLFCGAGAASASDKANYAAYMRYALRNSLQGTYTLKNLGFRCAYSIER